MLSPKTTPTRICALLSASYCCPPDPSHINCVNGFKCRRVSKSYLHVSLKVELTQTRLGVTCCDTHVLSIQIKLQNIHFGSISALKGIQDM